MSDMELTSEDSPVSRGDCPDLDAFEHYVRSMRVRSEVHERIDSHVASCPSCRSLLAEIRSAERFLGRFRGSETHDPNASIPRGPAQPTETPRQRTVRVEGYAIEYLLAFGGQGEVYKARQIGTDRAVAIKVPHGDTQRRPSTRYRFEREIELAARLDHPCVVRIFGSCTLDDGRLACVMEYVEGEMIDQWASAVRAGGNAGLRRIVGVMVQVADAIAFAHLRAVLHRDIKPGNVLVTPDGQPRVLDFGLAKSTESSGDSFVTHTGAFLGTLAYAAPEQISGGVSEIDVRTDVYALGLLLFQSLTGLLPYATDAPTIEILRQIREVAPPRPSAITPGVGDELDAIVLKALGKEKERRYASAAEFRDDLRAWLEGRAVRAKFDSRWYVVRKSVRRHRWAISGAAAAIAVAATVSGLGLVVREQASRARLADAVRDAQIVEAHHVRMAEARAAALDNFVFGENAAWDALLEPSPVLVERGIEGVAATGLHPTSSAYWTLWEIYQRTPIIASVPSVSVVEGGFVGADDQLATIEGDTVTRWDWRRWSPVQRADFEERPDTLRSEHDQSVVRLENGALYVSDASSNAWAPLGTLQADGFRIGRGRVAARSLDQQNLVLWDTTRRPVSIVKSFAAPDPHAVFWYYFFFDSSGRYLANIKQDGGLTIIDAHSGEVVYTSPDEHQALSPNLTATQRPGEFVVSGIDGALSVRVGADGHRPEVRVYPGLEETGLPPETMYLVPRPGVDRAVARTGLNMVWVVEAGSPESPFRLIRNLLNVRPELSNDGRYMALNHYGTPRVSIYDFDARFVRRLVYPAVPGPPEGRTVFDIAFDAEGKALYAASVDGSVRVFDPATGAPAGVLTEGFRGGVSRIAPADSGVLIGGHHIGVDPASLALLTPDGTLTPLLTGRRRFVTIIPGPDRTAWTLTGDGAVARIDLATGTVLAKTAMGILSPSARSMALTPSGSLLIALQEQGVRELDPQTLDFRRVLVEKASYRRILPHPAEPDQFIAVGDDGMIRVWRLEERGPGVLVREFGSHAGPIYCVAAHPGGRLIATGGGAKESRDIRIWDLNTGRELAGLDLLDQSVFDVEFSPDGRWLAACGRIRLSHPDEGGELVLVDLAAPHRAFAGNLEYHIARFTQEYGHTPSQAEGLRRLFPHQPAEGADAGLRP